MIKKKVLLSGSRGFTGKTLKKLLIEKNFQILEINSDIMNLNLLEKELENTEADYVIHLAAISNVEHSDIALMNMVNVTGTKNLLSIISNMKNLPQLVVVASSAYVYDIPKNGILNEDTKLNPLNDYGRSKLAMENVCKNFQNLPILITRPFNYTGIDQGLGFLVPKIINHFKLKKNEIELGNINVKREFNDVRDVCKIYCKLIQRIKFSTTMNICSGISYSIKDIIKICEQITSHSMKIKVNPKLIREKEVSNIVGDPKKMHSLLGNHQFRKLENTLKFMLHH